jgi:RNA polymerase sigma-70 factor (ECF subfamily)
MNDVDRYAALYRRWWSVVCDSATEMLDSAADGEDAAQHVFLRLWRDGGWDLIEQPERYFRRAARLAALDVVRRRTRARSWPLSRDLVESLRSREATPDELLLHAERRGALSRALAHLPERCAVVCTLVYVADLSHAEVGTRLGISVKAVAKQVERGRGHLRRMLGTAWGEGVSTIEDGGGRAFVASKRVETPIRKTLGLRWSRLHGQMMVGNLAALRRAGFRASLTTVDSRSDQRVR